jgi:hypothetical protein
MCKSVRCQGFGYGEIIVTENGEGAETYIKVTNRRCFIKKSLC